MKRMLIKLFLLVVLATAGGFRISGGEIDRESEYVKQHIERFLQHEQIISEIRVRLMEEKETVAYLDLDSIPIYSPISVTSIDRISSDYGMRFHPIKRVMNFHCGLDIASSTGTEVKSTAKGIVIRIDKSNHGYGNQVIISHGSNYETRYAHLSDITVTVGQEVNVGTMVGKVGSSGMSTGPHLHYEIISNNKSIDPMFFTYNNIEDRDTDQYLSTLITLDTA